MSKRFERYDTNAQISVLQSSEELHDLFEGHDGSPTLVIGEMWDCALAVHGTLDQLHAFSQRITEAVHQARTNTSGPGGSPNPT